jgi:pseudouridine-5'-phosphate glycosidase
MTNYLVLDPRIESALEENRPVVALESTVITHGLPYPVNLETAQAMEAAVHQAGAHPAIVAVIQGKIRVGLTSEQLEYLATRPRNQVRKCSRRDLATAIARGEDGATTVAGTMIVAHMSGIRLFATGGIGGVHRGQPFDVSADLMELGRTPVAVVCSGAKSILDLPKTREVLETQGVPVIGYQSNAFPAFYSPDSGLLVDQMAKTPVEVADIIRAHAMMNLQSGILITVPVPEEASINTAEVESAIVQANKEAVESGIHGAELTPWLLSRVNELTGGQSQRTNIAFLQNNARVAALIARALIEENA